MAQARSCSRTRGVCSFPQPEGWSRHSPPRSAEVVRNMLLKAAYLWPARQFSGLGTVSRPLALSWRPESERLCLDADPASRASLFVPALTGLGAPHWDPEARGTIFGLTRASTVADLARATLEGVAYQVADLIDAINADLPLPLNDLRVDGGMARSDPFLQFQADLLGLTLRRSPR